MPTQQATPTPRKSLTVHIKILTQPHGPTLLQRFGAMSKVYDTAGIDVLQGTLETLQHVAALNDLDIGGHGIGEPACEGEITFEQERLAEHRDNIPDGDIVVYICRSMTNANVGCANHPEDKPMAAITATSPLYTMAHEVAHVLGINGHPKKLDKTRLMNSVATAFTENDLPPIPTKSEIKKLRSSPLLK